jgi:hypothetical protein
METQPQQRAAVERDVRDVRAERDSFRVYAPSSGSREADAAAGRGLPAASRGRLKVVVILFVVDVVLLTRASTSASTFTARRARCCSTFHRHPS